MYDNTGRMGKNLSAKLGIKTGATVCVIHPNQETLAQIRSEEVALVIDKIEKDCDVILYWVDPGEDIQQSMLKLQNKIKPNGKIWVIIPKKEVAKKRNLAIDWNQVQRETLKTHLVDNKIASINDEEYGTQFVVRRKFRRDISNSHESP